MPKLIIICLIWFATPLASWAQCEVDQKIFQEGEKLTYKAFYNWNFIWLEAADVSFTVDRDYPEPVYNLTSIGTSLPKYDWFYKVRDTFRSQVDPETLLPNYYQRKTWEGSYRVNNEFWFNHSENNLYTDTNNSESEPSKDTFKLKPCTFDVLSAIYYTRSMNFEGRSIGEKIPIRFFIDNEYYDLFVRYLGKEDITTRENKKYSCTKFSILLVEGTIFEGGEDMTVWATDDENHVPVLVEAKILIGSVKAYLTNFEGLKYPMESYLGQDD